MFERESLCVEFGGGQGEGCAVFGRSGPLNREVGECRKAYHARANDGSLRAVVYTSEGGGGGGHVCGSLFDSHTRFCSVNRASIRRRCQKRRRRTICRKGALQVLIIAKRLARMAGSCRGICPRCRLACVCPWRDSEPASACGARAFPCADSGACGRSGGAAWRFPEPPGFSPDFSSSRPPVRKRRRPV